jgi:hypothetical protein
MKPTVYLPLADLRFSGLCPASASSAARFGVGRGEMDHPWIQAEGGQAGTTDQRQQSAGGSGVKRTR